MPSFESFWKEGHIEIPKPQEPNVILSDYRADPNLFPLPTESGKIEIFSELIDSYGYEDCIGHPVWLEPVEWLGGKETKDYPLHMISNQPKTRLHGQMDNGKISRESKINQREPVWIHPDDARERNLSSGDIARLFNLRGEILAGIVVTNEVRKGVVQLSTGAWYDPENPNTKNSLDKHGNPNVLTIDKGTSRLGQGPSAHSTLIQIEKFNGPLPPLTAFKPPVILQK